MTDTLIFALRTLFATSKEIAKEKNTLAYDLLAFRLNSPWGTSFERSDAYDE